MKIDAKIFGLTNGKDLANKISKWIDIDLCEVKISKFADGEILVRALESVRNKNVFVVQSTSKNSDYSVNDTLMELVFMIDALKRANAKNINIIIPYFGYSRQDRKCLPREPISAKVVANIIEKAGASRLTILDLHSPQIQGFFNVPVDDFSVAPLFFNYLKDEYHNDFKDFVIVAPDQGSSKKCMAIAKLMGVPLAIIDKERVGDNQIKINGYIGDVKGKIAILFDDIIDTGGTILRGGEYLVNNGGAKEIIIMASHGLFNKNAPENLFNSPAISKVIVSNSVPSVRKYKHPKLFVIDISKYLSEIVNAWINEESVGHINVKYLKGLKA